MSIVRRIFLFLLTNIAVLVLISIILMVLSKVFNINLTGYGSDLSGILFFSAIVGFSGSIISLFMSKSIAKRAYKIQLLTSDMSLGKKEQVFYTTVENISREHNITLPEIGIYQSVSPNAFATGATKNSSLVAVSSGLLQEMNANQIEGVVAHEMAHILNGDMVTMTLLQWVINTFVVFGSRVIANIAQSMFGGEQQQWPGMIYYITSIGFDIIFGLFASMIVMAFSRHREYRADEGSARFVGKEKMISALQELQQLHKLAPKSSSKLATSMITTKDSLSWLKKLFMSHPPLEKRIAHIEHFRM